MISRFLPHPVRRLLGVKTQHPNLPGYRLIDQPGQLQPLLDAMDHVTEVVMDTEADNMYRFRVRVCLLQFYVRGEVFLVDALAPTHMEALWPRLAKKELVMHGSDFDLRLLGGKNIALAALPGFVDVSFGFRARGGRAPNEGPADLSLGLYLWPKLMLLAQNFNVVSTPSHDPSHPRWAQSKAQLSLVYSLSAEWRAQVGGFTTLAGVNAYREYGAVLALWRRF